MNCVVIPHSASGLNSYVGMLADAVRSLGYSCKTIEPLSELAEGSALWVQWPEALVGYRSPSADELLRVTLWLQRARERGTVLWTAHNLCRHGMPNDPGFDALYRLSARFAKVQIHHGRTSVGLIQERYPEAGSPIVKVVGHGGYWNLVGPATREQARARLGLPLNKHVLVAFGELRTDDEYRLVLTAARSKWRVLLAGRIPYVRRRHRLQVWFERRRAERQLLVRQGMFSNENVDELIKACDAVLIARRDTLNSGNIFLGMTFNRAVIGPDVGNMGEVLRETGNSVYDPTRPQSLLNALADLHGRDLEGLGQRNGAWLQAHGQWTDIARAAIEGVLEAEQRSR